MIDEDRMLHILAVANLMKEKAKVFNLDGNEMFALGFLHDLGYGLNDERHNELGGKILEKQNYKFHNEVRYHGMPKCKFSSPALDLLNWCDMHTNFQGKFVSFEERLNEIALRHGATSNAYINSKLLIDELKDKKSLQKLLQK